MGMIPRAVDQVFRVAEEMKARGWEYKMEGQFLEIVKFLFHNFYLFLLIALFFYSTTKRLTTSLVKVNSTRRNTRLNMTRKLFPLVLLTLKLFLFILHRKSVPC
jgi:hypothetical protein